MSSTRLTKGQQVLVTETERGKLAAPELAVVFEDYGTDYVNIRLTNGQIHCVRRASLIVPDKTKSKPATKRGPAKDIEDAVRAAQLYIGKGLSMRITDEQKLYDRMHRKINAVARRRGIDANDAYQQIMGEAKRRGGITPMPGKDI